MEVYCTASLQSVMATAQPGWNASALLGRRKGYLCFLHITVTQTRSFKLFCSLDGLHNSLPNLHNNKLKKGGVREKKKKSACSWTSRGLEDLDAGAGAQHLFTSGTLNRHEEKKKMLQFKCLAIQWMDEMQQRADKLESNLLPRLNAGKQGQTAASLRNSQKSCWTRVKKLSLFKIHLAEPEKHVITVFLT